MKQILSVVLAFGLGGGLLADEFYWNASPSANVWGNWGEVANWGVVTPGATNAATRLPGENDTLHFPVDKLYADLGGGSWKLGVVDLDFGYNEYKATGGYIPSICVSNGTLEITKTYEAYSGHFSVDDGGEVIIGTNVTDVREANGNASYVDWTIKRGGKVKEYAKKRSFFQCYWTVADGGEFDFAPREICWSQAPGWPNYFVNRGMMIITNGCTFLPTPAPDQTKSTNWKDGDTTKSFRPRDGFATYVAFDQLGGTMRLGGSFDNRGHSGAGYFFSVGGGTLDVVRDTTFSGFRCTVSNDAQVTVNTAAGATIDMSTFTIGANAAFTKTGAGALILGASRPNSLAVDGGYVGFGTAGAIDLTGLSFAAGSGIVFTRGGQRLDSLTGYADLDFKVDVTRAPVGVPFLSSTDPELLAHVKTRVAAALGDAYDVLLVDDGLVYAVHVDNVFDATSGKTLDDPDGWSSHTVPVGAAAVIRGAGTVTLNPATPAFSAITLELGAALEVEGGTETEPFVLPPLTLVRTATLRVKGEAFAHIVNGISASADEERLPVFEIATNGVVFMQDPAWPNRGIYLKNLDFRLYGQLRVPEATSSGDYLGSQMFFGYAESGETSYFAFTADGGSIYAHHAAAAYFGNRSLVSIACPAAGGRVKVVRDVLFRDYRKIYDLSIPDNPYGIEANSGYYFGVNNPVDEVFNVIVDGCLLSPAGPTRFAGGSRTRFVNGARFERPGELSGNQGYGHTRGVFIQDAAEVTFAGGKFFLDHPCGNTDLGKGLSVNSAAADTSALILGGGAKFTLWEQYGNGRGVCTVTDGTFYVPRLHGPRMQRNATTGEWTIMATWTQTNTPAFNGFASVNVPEGGRLVFDASDEININGCNERYRDGTPEEDNPYYNAANSGNSPWYNDFWEWDRTTALAVPVTGAGDVTVTNTLAGTDPRKGMWYFSPVRNDFPDLSFWSMNLVLRGADNTCAGTLSAATNVNAFLHLANGSRWAGTLKANSHVKFGDPIAAREGAAAAPVSASVGAIDFEGALVLRLWKDGEAKSSDFLEIGGDSTGTARTAGLAGVGMDGYVPQPGESFTVARCPKNAQLPKAARGWKVKAVDDPDDAGKVLVQLALYPAGTRILIR